MELTKAEVAQVIEALEDLLRACEGPEPDLEALLLSLVVRHRIEVRTPVH